MFDENNILVKDTQIKIRKKGNFIWVPSFVIRTYNMLLEVYLSPGFFSNVLMPDDSIECCINKDGEIYKFNTIVYNIKVASRTVVLKSDNSEILCYERNSVRYDVMLCATASKDGTHNEPYCIIKDVSKFGVSFMSKEEYEESENIQLTLYPEYNIEISISGEILRKNKIDNYYIYGVLLTIDSDSISESMYFEYLKKVNEEENEHFYNFKKYKTSINDLIKE